VLRTTESQGDIVIRPNRDGPYLVRLSPTWMTLSGRSVSRLTKHVAILSECGPGVNRRRLPVGGGWRQRDTFDDRRSEVYGVAEIEEESQGRDVQNPPVESEHPELGHVYLHNRLPRKYTRATSTKWINHHPRCG
jgi:hypothetical protein